MVANLTESRVPAPAANGGRAYETGTACDLVTAHQPAVVYPEHVMTQDDMLAMAQDTYHSSKCFDRIREMIRNTNIDRRHFAVDQAALGGQSGLAERTTLFQEHALELARRATSEALVNAGVSATDIDLIISVSCTGHIMPSLDAYLINDLGFRSTVKRMPVSQLGCSGGASALIKAQDYCLAYPNASVLVVAVETSSLCFFPEQKDLTSAVCSSIFGDGAAALVVSGSKVPAIGGGLKLRRNFTYTMPNTEHYIRFIPTDQGYHLTLDKEVMHAIPEVTPFIESFLKEEGLSTQDLEFVIAHTGGRRILDGVRDSLDVEEHLLAPSRQSLQEAGNTASVSVLDVLHRTYQLRRRPYSSQIERGIIVAFGPGFTMDVLSAEWR